MVNCIKYFYISFFLLLPSFLFAYLDPGTGSLLLYAVIGIASSVIFALRNVWYRIIEFIFSKSGKTIERSELPDIVFHSEGKKYWHIFQPVIAALLQKNIPCAYITPDKQDPGLQFESTNKQYHPICPGKELVTIAYLNKIKTALVVSTTPGLDVYMWKRSKNVKQYVHIFHAPTGVDFYEKYALSFYDIIFSVGPFTEKGQNALDDYRGLPRKKFYPVGCTYYDYLVKEAEEKKSRITPDGNTLLYAPSWGKRSSITKYKGSIIAELLKTGMNVIFRPHPQSFISDKQILDEIKKTFSHHPHFQLDVNATGVESMAAADLLITDLSGVLFDFAYLYTRPIIIVNYEAAAAGYEAEDMGVYGYDIQASLALTEKADDDITALSQTISQVMQQYDSAAEKIKTFREQNIYNFGNAGTAAAEYIIDLVEEVRKK
ncbi:MAG: CDP-glycerol glycerophosphotransferase family protein [Treponema phagedenis]|uniref:CDP-glycerol glycerophosphotransferase family protein n=1 Tax=Treponema phagedenis TaxID=162 RepID=UPI003133E5A1